jgi:hypothetical protein
MWNAFSIISFLLALSPMAQGQGTTSINPANHENSFNRSSELVQFLNQDVGDIASAPNEGLEELNQKIWRHHEFKERFLERDELDMIFIENHLKRRDRRSAVVLVGDRVAALVFLNPRTKKARGVSTFSGRNVYRIKQIGLDQGYLVRKVSDNLSPSGKSSRAPASTADPIRNAKGYAEMLVEDNPLPKRAIQPNQRLRYRYILK